MMRTIFTIFIVLHAMIHGLGFLKAFHFAELNELNENISRIYGTIWGIVFIIFIVAAVQFIVNFDLWWFSCAIGVVLSQLMIFLFWQDAKFGSIPNLIILLIVVIAFANWQFDRKVRSEITQIFSSNTSSIETIPHQKPFSELPHIVQTWINHSNIEKKGMISSVRLKQKIFMKMKPDQKEWTEAHAEQYFALNTPAFLWRVKLKMNPFVHVVGRDLFSKGKGRMEIKLFSLLRVVDATGPKMDSGTLQRYLGEMIWFPAAAHSQYITWEPVDTCSAKATMDYNGTVDSGIFYFNTHGEFTKYSALRFKENETDSERIPWEITVVKYKEIDGVRIPVELEATWKLPEGDWTWLHLEISEIEYNNPEVY
ncbi:MAG: hypothetical protein H6696_04720 [Deferribacteres bacterium]|nr:hypothetical protein [Deferribacteres bacterium]